MSIETITVHTIGFTQTSAESFFERIKRSGVKRVLDVRLHNTSQLAGFARADHLKYFLREICLVDYLDVPLLAPTDEMLKGFKVEGGSWDEYADRFMGLMAARKIETALGPDLFDGACLLCSEPEPHHCHRSLVMRHLITNAVWGGRLRVTHL